MSSKQKRINKDIQTYEECEIAPELITRIIRNTPETQTWHSKDTVRIMPLTKRTKEYEVTARYFLGKTLTTTHYHVVKIERIENPFFMAAFVLKRLELQATKPKTHVHTKTMFHATSRAATNRILAHSFDWRLAGQKRGEKWGHGVSLSPYSDFAAKFTQPEKGVCSMLMCLMLERNTIIGSKGLELPPEEYDTTRSHDGKVFVKFDDFTVYPAYRITYRIIKNNQ